MVDLDDLSTMQGILFSTREEGEVDYSGPGKALAQLLHDGSDTANCLLGSVSDRLAVLLVSRVIRPNEQDDNPGDKPAALTVRETPKEMLSAVCADPEIRGSQMRKVFFPD